MRTIFFLIFAVCFAWAQSDTNSVTVSATRVIPDVPPDQVGLAVTITAGVDKTLDDVLAVLTSAKIGLSELNMMYTSSGSEPEFEWIFSTAVKLSDLNRILAVLSSARSKLAAGGGLRMDYQVSTVFASQQATATQQCSYGALLSDAQNQAQKLAAAAGVPLGPVLVLVDQTQTAVLGESAAPGAAGQPYLVAAWFSTPRASPDCNLTVRFKLGQ